MTLEEIKGRMFGDTRVEAEDAERLVAEVERLLASVKAVTPRVRMMLECSEASLEHLEGLHRAPAARGSREAYKALAELEGKG